MTRKNREYIQSDEESKNPLMNLKKSMDLGEKHDIELENESIVNLSNESANEIVSTLLTFKPSLRENILYDMFKNESIFKTYADILTGAEHAHV